MANISVTRHHTLPPLPPYTLQAKPDLLSFISDINLSVISPVIGYWMLALFFHYIDINDIWPQYRLHTPAEISKRNHATRYDVARSVILQQVVQVIVGAMVGLFEEQETVGKEGYDIAVWATWIRMAQRALPALLSGLGLNAAAISKSLSPTRPIMAGILAGGNYSFRSVSIDTMVEAPMPCFVAWELFVAKLAYWYVIPLLQFVLAAFVMDTWAYGWHRTMHMNKWMYNKFHSRHHELYVPYAYGAIYNHPMEGLVMDTIGASLSAKLAGLNARQILLFFTFANLKTVGDHCGYSLPWDPLQQLFANNSAYHDIHHQTWGIKTNFSQPFFVFWDKFYGTQWKGGDVSQRRAKAQNAAQRLLDAETSK